MAPAGALASMPPAARNERMPASSGRDPGASAEMSAEYDAISAAVLLAPSAPVPGVGVGGTGLGPGLVGSGALRCWYMWTPIPASAATPATAAAAPIRLMPRAIWGVAPVAYPTA